MTDLADVNVRLALSSASSSPTLFGVDSRPIGGTVWSVACAYGQALLVGSPCPSPVMDSCHPIPTGVQRLVDDLKALSDAMLGQPACEQLRRGRDSAPSD